MKIKQKLLLLLTGVLSVVTINAQDAPIRVETNLVTLNVALTDKQGRPVRGLRQEQFEVFDDKLKQPISHFSAEDASVSFGIVYDMHPTTDERTTAVSESLREFTKNLGADDRQISTVEIEDAGGTKTLVHILQPMPVSVQYVEMETVITTF